MNHGEKQGAQRPPSLLGLSHDDCEILLCSPIGATHLDHGQPCQDACMASQQFYKGYPFTLLAVADGHGSAKYSRSEVGAHLAVEAVREAATWFIQSLVRQLEAQPSHWPTEAEHEFKTRFGKALLMHWRTRVIQHAQEQAPDAPESAPADVDAVAIEADAEPMPDAPESIQRYGTTVAVVLMFEQRLFVGSIGDSAVYVVRPAHDSTQVYDLFPRAADAVGLGTPSLCSANAAQNWEAAVLDPDNIGMVMLSTDGLPDSLEQPERSVQDMYEQTVANGLDWLKHILPGQLQRWSAEGVGDDMAMIVCFPAFQTRCQSTANEVNP